MCCGVTLHNTRLCSIESQPKKVVVVVVVVVVVIIVGHKNLTLKFGQNWVNNKGYIVVVVFIVLVLLLLLIQKPRFNLVRFISLIPVFCC